MLSDVCAAELLLPRHPRGQGWTGIKRNGLSFHWFDYHRRTYSHAGLAGIQAAGLEFGDSRHIQQLDRPSFTWGPSSHGTASDEPSLCQDQGFRTAVVHSHVEAVLEARPQRW